MDPAPPQPTGSQPPAAEARRLIVSFSPLAGARSAETRAREVAAELVAAGYEVCVTSDRSELEDRSQQWHDAGDLRCLLACGGDGTAAFVRNHTPLAAPLMIVPLGTENLLGQYLDQSSLPSAVRQTVDHGVVLPLDLGCARNCSAAAAGKPDRQYFLSMISAGFDAEVVRRLHQRRQGNITRFSYIQPALDVIRSYEYPELQLYCDEAQAIGNNPLRCRWVFGFNLPLYARGWTAAPDAVATDGLFDVCTFHRGSVRNVARYLWHVIWKSHFRLADANLIRSAKLRIEAAGAVDVAYQLDGDLGGSLPVEIEVLPHALRLLAMPRVAERLGCPKEGKVS